MALKITAEGPQGTGKTSLIDALRAAGWEIAGVDETSSKVVFTAIPNVPKKRGETVNWLERKDDFLGWAIIHLMSAAADGKRRPWKDAFAGADSKALQVELKINGVECSFTELIERIDGDLARMVAVEAAKLVQNKFGDKMQEIFAMSESFTRKVREVLGLPSEE